MGPGENENIRRIILPSQNGLPPGLNGKNMRARPANAREKIEAELLQLARQVNTLTDMVLAQQEVIGYYMPWITPEALRQVTHTIGQARAQHHNDPAKGLEMISATMDELLPKIHLHYSEHEDEAV